MSNRIKSVKAALHSRLRQSNISGHPPINDDSPLLFGKKYKGVPMAEVPDEYLIWVLDELRSQSYYPKSYKAMLYQYLKDNEDAMYKNVRDKKK